MLSKELYKKFTENTHYVDYENPAIKAKAEELFDEQMTDVDKTKKAFYFVRDEIKHSFDIGAKVVSVTASEALLNRTGVCHVKSNLLAALLRSQGIPAGFCFQYLTLDDNDASRGYVTHGYNAVYLDNHWIKLDTRGNKENVHAEFSMDEPILAYPVRKELNEYKVPGIFSIPNMTSMRYLENLDELVISKYADCKKVMQEPDIVEIEEEN